MQGEENIDNEHDGNAKLFSEASLYRSSVHYQVGVILADLRREAEGLVRPTLRFACGLKVCCVIFSPGHGVCWDKETGELA
jgi:hypothetical protein